MFIFSNSFEYCSFNSASFSFIFESLVKASLYVNSLLAISFCLRASFLLFSCNLIESFRIPISSIVSSLIINSFILEIVLSAVTISSFPICFASSASCLSSLYSFLASSASCLDNNTSSRLETLGFSDFFFSIFVSITFEFSSTSFFGLFTIVSSTTLVDSFTSNFAFFSITFKYWI